MRNFRLLPALAIVLALAGACLPRLAHAEVAVPALQARVTDLTGTLSDPQREALESKLTSFEQAKGSQIAVLILPTTQPETIEEYGIHVADQWKLGRKGVDDGAILIVAKDDHRLRIEVGYGLEGALNDATSNRIISEIISPQFKQGRFYEGIDAGVDRMIGVVNGEPLPPPKRSGRSNGSDPLGAVFVVFFIALFIGRILRSMLGSLPASLIIGGLVGFVAMAIVGSLVVSILSGVLSALFAFLFYSAGPGFGGWGGGGFGGGGFGGGGFGGGGFSGGGGGFGGGGSSGSW